MIHWIITGSKSRLHPLDLREMPPDVHGMNVEGVAEIDPKGQPRRGWRPESERIPVQCPRRIDQLEKASITREKCLGHARARCRWNRSLRRLERFRLHQRFGDLPSNERFAIRSTWRACIRPRVSNQRFNGGKEERIHESKVLEYFANAPRVRRRFAQNLLGIERTNFERDTLVVGAHLRAESIVKIFLEVRHHSRDKGLSTSRANRRQSEATPWRRRIASPHIRRFGKALPRLKQVA